MADKPQSRRALSDEEWERERVLPIFHEAQGQTTDDDIADPTRIAAFMRGEISLDELVKAADRSQSDSS